MAITRSTPIQQADMQALAVLANDALWPLVNPGGSLVSGWPGHAYSVFSDAPTNTVLADPQPAYSFAGSSSTWLATLNRIRADYWTLIFTAGLGADEILLSPDNIVSGPWVVGVNDEDTFPKGGFPPGNSSLQIPAPNYPLDFLKHAGELIGALNTSFTCYKNVQFCYAENDAPDGITAGVGRQVNFGYGSLTTTPSISYTASLAGHWKCQVWWAFTWTGGGVAPDAPPTASGFTVSATPGAGITWSTAKLCPYMNQVILGDPTYGPVNSGVYALIATIEMDIAAGSQAIDFNITAAPANYALSFGPLITSRLIFSTSDSVSPISAIHPTSPCLIVSAPDMPAGSDFVINGNDSIAFWNIDQPDVKGVWIAKTLPVPGMNVFLDVDMPPYVGAGASDLYHGKAIAVSQTLVSFADFLDNPPTGQPANGDPMWTSSMRQQAEFYSGEITETIYVPGYGDYTFDLGPKYNLISESVQPQAAQWLLRRDTDFVPFDFGFNNTSTGYYAVQLAAADPSNTRLSVNYFNSPVYSTVKSVKIRLVAKGSTKVGWKDGQFQYGDELATKLKIYVNPNGSFPLTSYDFATTNNEVTIDGTRTSDGGMHYLAALKAAGGINIAIQNLTDADVEYDMIFEMDYATNLQRQYFPPWNECFSSVINGTPPGSTSFYGFASLYPTFLGLKPIPQNGYCIFKVRATRMPVQNSAGISITPSSGAEINVILGQNRLAPDNTLSFAPFMDDIISPGAGDTGTGAGDTDMGAGGSGQPAMLTIPANSRDSGDVDVFIPVLGGNELVWQCDDDVIVEAWANWQPVFFATGYGFTSYYINMEISYDVDFNPTAFQFCLAFTNFFDPNQNNTPDWYGTDVYGDNAATHVQFPPSIEIYKDLEACLSLI